MTLLRTIVISSLFLFMSLPLCGQSDNPVFMQLTTADGLSFNSVYSIMQDNQGFIWIGTLGGLDRYDGIEFRNYRVVDKKYFQYVSPLMLDKRGHLWSGGILLDYDPACDRQQVLWKSMDDTLYWLDNIQDMKTGPDNKLYFIDTQCIYRRDQGVPDTVVNIFLHPDPATGIERINKLNFDNEGKLWLGTDAGLFSLDTASLQLTHLDALEYPENKYVHNFMFDSSGLLWVLFTDAYLTYDPHTKKTSYNPYAGNDMPAPSVIYQTGNGIIWAGTGKQGLYYLDPQQGRFRNFLDRHSITSLFEDQDKRLWIGTDNAGILVYDTLQNFFKPLPLNLEDKTLYTPSVSRIIAGEDKKLWIGSWSHGLLDYDLKKGKAEIIDPSNSSIDMLYRDISGRIWYNHLRYLVCYDPDKGISQRIPHPVPHQYPILNSGNSLTEMVRFNGELIVSSDYGQLYTLDPRTNHFKLIFEEIGHPIRAIHAVNDFLLFNVAQLGIIKMNTSWEVIDTIMYRSENKGLIAYDVSCLFIDSYDTLWVAGYGGMAKYNPATGQLENKYVIRENANYLTSILEDGKGNLWIGSSKGIYRYDRAAQELVLFSTEHGVIPGRFFINCAVKTDSGDMYFGGNGGIVHFNPEEFRINRHPPPVVLTDLIINTSSDRKRKRNLIPGDTAINFRKSIRLLYYQNSFTIKYAALNYSASSYNQYRYKLEGLDEDWLEAGNHTQATYTNLSGGVYRFYVAGSNNEDIWNPEARILDITIDPPPWKSWWALTLYILAIAGIILYLFYHTIRRLRLQHLLDIEKKEAEKLKEIDAAKSRFFAGISHEFRTPLSLIIDPAQQIMRNAMPRRKEEMLLRLIIKNARRLLFLINQILDLSRLRNSKLKLEAEETDFVAFIKPVAEAFASRAETLAINYRIEFPEGPLSLWVDREKMEQTLVNLLSNAFKFCQQGEIKVQLTERNDTVELTVSDTGIGIPADQLDRIFENYYQVEQQYTPELAGSGIGLYLVKEYMLLHHGKVTVESIENEGSIFTLILLKGRDHLKQAEIKVISEVESVSTEEFSPGNKLSGAENKIPTEHEVLHHRLLIVEDNPEMADYLAENLGGYYKLFLAHNGKEGLTKTLEHYPDLIVSDVLMPEMDGYQFCHNVKEDERISHIPIILLTAKNLEEDVLKGLSLGAEDYLVKPFRMDELRFRIRNHLALKEKQRKRFLEEFRIKPEKTMPVSMDDKFLQKVFNQMEEHFSEEQFGVEKLSELIGMSRKHLHHKINTLTGQSPTDLIRHFRLRKAAWLLGNKSGSVSQVCYEVGFSNLSYFSKCFHTYFGKYPSEYTLSGEKV